MTALEDRLKLRREQEQHEQEEREAQERAAAERRAEKEAENLQNAYLRRTGRKEMKP